MKIRAKYIQSFEDMPENVAFEIKSEFPEICGDRYCKFDVDSNDPIISKFIELMTKLDMHKFSHKEKQNPKRQYSIRYFEEFEPSDFKNAEYITMFAEEWAPDDDFSLRREKDRIILAHEEERFLEPFYQGDTIGAKLSPICLGIDGCLCISKNVYENLMVTSFSHIAFKDIWIEHKFAEARKIDEYIVLASDLHFVEQEATFNNPKWGRPFILREDVEKTQPIDLFWSGYKKEELEVDLCVSQRFYQFWNKHFPRSASWERPVVLV
jgi:hypothetical protein